MLFGFKEKLKEYYKMDEKEFLPFLRDIENEIYLVIKKDFLKKMKDISNFAIESFKRNFWYDEGLPRVWNKLNENVIDELYKKYKQQNYNVFEHFKKFYLLRNPLQRNYYNHE
jgi:hypothetical protein